MALEEALASQSRFYFDPPGCVFGIRILLKNFTNFSVLVCFLSWKVLSSSLSYENKQFMVFSFPDSTSNMMVSSFFNIPGPDDVVVELPD